MFTGIVEYLGKIKQCASFPEYRQFTIEAGILMNSVKLGDSIAVNGTCLTVTDFDLYSFKADVAPETLDKTNLGSLKTGDSVNLERALSLSGRLDGHLVSGHIDGIASIVSKRNRGNAIIIELSCPAVLVRSSITKGSIAVDGISLTINRCEKTTIEVSVIPHTAAKTTIGIKNIGDKVNIETDMLGKYVFRFLENSKSPIKPGADQSTANGISMDLLRKSGFM